MKIIAEGECWSQDRADTESVSDQQFCCDTYSLMQVYLSSGPYQPQLYIPPCNWISLQSTVPFRYYIYISICLG